MSFSRFGEIKLTNPSDGFSQDFTGPEFAKLHRFASEDLLSINLKRISAPRSCLHINNLPQGVTGNQLQDLIQNKANVKVLDILSVKKCRDKQEPETPSRAMVFVQVANASDAMLALALIGGAWATPVVPAGLRVSFTDSNVARERSKFAADKKMEVLDGNQAL